MTRYGQVIVGPPGAGKSTYARGMQQFLSQMGRDCIVVNLDFANEHVNKRRSTCAVVGAEDQTNEREKDETESGTYECALDVRDLVSLEMVMEEYKLGPNGGMMFCMEYLLDHVDWLVESIEKMPSSYVLFDCPGQVELFSHHRAMEEILSTLSKRLDFRLCSVHLIDSFYCLEPATFISAVLLVASTMLRLSLPHVNVLTKIDLLPSYGPLPFTMNFYTELTNLKPLVRYIDNPIASLEEIEREEKEEQERKRAAASGDGDDEEDEYDDLSSYGSFESDGGRNPYPVAPTNGNGSSKLRGRLSRMSWELCDVLSDFGLVSFLPMNIQDATTVGRVAIAIDKANGYTFAANESLQERKRQESLRNPQGGGTASSDGSLNHLFSMASQDLEPEFTKSIEIYEKYESF